VAGLWVNHLVACASGVAINSVVLGLDGQVVIAPLAQHEALRALQTLLDAYRQAWLRPLPVACKTAWAYVRAQAKNARLAAEQPDKPEKQKDPHEAAQAVFEDGFLVAGEMASSPYLARAFNSYEDLEDELAHWAHVLYGALYLHASVVAADVAEEEAA
jgi:exodeoxyribonuclease V gamma subunit